jgi:hypothetical protein
MNTWTRLIALPAVFLPLAALAQGQTSSDAESAAVEALKASVRERVEVDTVRMTDAGVACITYRMENETGGASRAHAVVDGEKVLRSTIGNTRFEKAWKEKCAGAGS